MRIAKAMKLVSRVKGEIQDLKGRITGCISELEENEFDEKYTDLSKKLSEKTKQLITLKSRIMSTNIKHGMFTVILNLGELKSRLEHLKSLNPREGVEYGYDDRKMVYKSQINGAEKRKLMEECQEAINKLTDELDEFNGSQDLEEIDVTVRSL